MEEKYTVTAAPNLGDVYWYEIYHTYSGMKGAVRIGFGIFFLGLGIYSLGRTEIVLSVLTVLLGMLNIVFTPIWLLLKAWRLAKGLEPLQYIFAGDKVTVSRKGEKKTVSWNAFYRIVWTWKCLFLYTDTTHAFLIPCRDIQDIHNKLRELTF